MQLAVCTRATPVVVFSSNDFYGVQQALRQGLGVGVLPRFLNRDGALQAMTDLAGVATDKALPLYLVMHEDVRRSARVRTVADWLLNCFPHDE